MTFRCEHIGGATLYLGDSRVVLSDIDDNSIDSVCTDPPYALVSIVKRFGSANAAPVTGNAAYARASAGFMGQSWDTGETAFDPAFWAEVLRVLKPGGHVIAASGTRTYHRLACAIEDAGFEIRDMISWLYGSGFPKSHNQPGGWGTALKPACEPWVLARKPLIGTVAANVLAHGTGAINVDGCRVGDEERVNASASHNEIYGQFKGAEINGRTAIGRWPANVIHDGSDEVIGAFPDSESRGGFPKRQVQSVSNSLGHYAGDCDKVVRNDSGSAARFFYSAKADAMDRLGSKHPTVKPVDLMQYLCRLITPPGGTVLDPFAGSGSTGEAAFREGFKSILIEREEAYFHDIVRRMNLASAGPMARRHGAISARGKVETPGGLFDGGAA